jgi:chromosome segregation protein
MHLSSVTLFGFKSFVDRLSIDFQPGITAIVGPNGCGKSNIADAIRWVLGEQSPKALRGERMEDLIFVGNTHRKPVGVAEVSLTVTGVQGGLSVPYDEVTTTRRLYRSGESEYLLNKVPCRLKDITGIFLDTGLGPESYALIEQGAIATLLHSKPVDRRAMLEEAAGIMTYKVKRKTALSRLEAAEQNLLRVRDILLEVERQRNSLQRQAKKAERYQGLEKRLQELKRLLTLHEERRLLEQLKALEVEAQRLGDAQAILGARMSQLEAGLEQARLQDLHLERQIAAVQERLYTVKSRREQQEAEGKALERLQMDLKTKAEELQKTLLRLRGQMAEIQGEEERGQEELTQLTKALEGTEQAQGETADLLTSTEAELNAKEKELEAQKGLLISLTEALVAKRNHLAYLTERQQLLRREEEELTRQIDTSKAQAQTVARTLQGLMRELEGLEQEITRRRQEREQLSADIQQLQEHLGRLTEERSGQREEMGRLESRLKSLEELEAGLEGYGEGQRFLLKAKAAGVTACRHIEGPLVHFLKVPVGWEKAVEALLGDLLQGLLTPTGTDALAALEYLQQEGKGWATLLPRQAEWFHGNGQSARLQAALDSALASLEQRVAERVIGTALGCLEAPKSLEPLLEAMLGDALIVQDLPTALALVRSLHLPARVATVAGEVVNARGPVHGGKAPAMGFLSRRREQEELQQALARVQTALTQGEAETGRAQGELGELQQALISTEGALRRAEEGRRDVEHRVAEARAVDSRLGSQVELFSAELLSLTDELHRIHKEVQEVGTTLEELLRQEKDLKDVTQRLDQEVSSLRIRREKLQGRLADLRIQGTSLQERREALVKTLTRLQGELNRTAQEEARILQELQDLEGREREVETTLSSLREARKGLLMEEETEASAAVTLQGERDRLREALREQEDTLKGLRHEATLLTQKETSLSTRRAELTTERTLLHRRLQEEFPLPLEKLQEQEMGIEQDPAAIQEEMEATREKIASMGPINMAALEEYETLSERHRFLTTQAEDLTNSATSLKATIAEINRTIQGLFAETLGVVNRHLNHFWQRLFEGGEAELATSEGGETEEPGVEIRVRIPGKRTTTLSLLSGGEKTLGAIAFLMALCAARPSPFVLLDEVDAALDDANVDRFVSLLRDLATTSQFIIITHHPRTMEIADALYGITMEEPGVSRLISVRLQGRIAQAVSPS